MSATLEAYKQAMPTIASVMTSMTKAGIETNFAKFKPAPTPPAPVELTNAKIMSLFNDVVTYSSLQEAITANGGLVQLAGKHSMTRSQCVAVLDDLKAGYALYKSPEVEDVTT